MAPLKTPFICKLQLSEVALDYITYITENELKSILQSKGITHNFKKGDIVYINDNISSECEKIHHIFMYNGNKFLLNTTDKEIILPQIKVPTDFPSNYWDCILDNDHLIIKMKYDTEGMNLTLIKKLNNATIYKDLNTNYYIVIYSYEEEVLEDLYEDFINDNNVISYLNCKRRFIYNENEIETPHTSFEEIDNYVEPEKTVFIYSDLN